MLQLKHRGGHAVQVTVIAVALAMFGPVNVYCHAKTASDPTIGVLDLAAELGISPNSVIVTGIADSNIEFVATMLTRLENAEFEATTLMNLRAQADELGSQLTTIQAALGLDPEDAALADSYNQVTGELAGVEAQIDGLLEDLAADVFEGLSESLLTAVEIWKSSAHYAVPVEFRTTEREHSEWKAIEVAIRAERRAERLGKPLAAEHDAVLSSVRSEPDVIQAAYWIDNFHDQVTAMFAHYAP